MTKMRLPYNTNNCAYDASAKNWSNDPEYPVTAALASSSVAGSISIAHRQSARYIKPDPVWDNQCCNYDCNTLDVVSVATRPPHNKAP